jgi:succinate dehydrogenase / fumarate reductase cytochrome b subunit
MEDRESFNSYAHFMTNFPLIKIISYGLYLSIVLHSVDGLLLARSNKKARETSYVQYNGKANASWSSRNMAILGTLTLVFLIIHMKSFWYEMHFGNIPVYTNSNGKELKDLYSITVAAFEQPWYSIFYVFAMMGLGFHLWHGFASSFQTLGINHAKYTPFIEIFGKAFSVIISLAFASIPLYILLS